ncbi:MAG: molybdopterin-dependent oxidoreductase [Candidatus Bathyarchaeia archaeon]
MKKILTMTITIIFLLSIIANIHINLNAQTTDPTALTITGQVNHPTNLTLTQIQAIPKTTLYAAIICVDFPSVIVEEGNWTGVQLGTLLETAGIQSGAVKIVIAASDGYSSDLSVDDALQSNVILAYEKDGEALSALRLVVPGRWGYKWVNFVSKIEVVNYNYLGFWESRGYSDTAIIGQDPGGGGTQKPQNTPSPTTALPTTQPNTPATPTPTPTKNATTGTQATQSPTQNSTEQAFPTETIYAVAIALVAAVAAAALIVHKKVRK